VHQSDDTKEEVAQQWEVSTVSSLERGAKKRAGRKRR
jgi:hypothetical protein